MKRMKMNGLALFSAFTLFACGSEPLPYGEYQGLGTISVDPRPSTASVYSESSSDGFDPAAFVNQRVGLHNRLLSESADMDLANPIVAQVTEQEMNILLNAPDTGRLLVGVEKQVAKSVEFGDPSQELGSIKYSHSSGSYVWVVAVRSEQASGIRVHFTGFDLVRGSELYVYNQEGDAFGPYTGKGPLGTGEFWSHTVSGQQALIQLRHFGPAEELNRSMFVIQDIGHLGPKYLLPFLQQAHSTRSFCNFNDWCVEDASCYSNSVITAAEDAIAHIVFKSGRYWYICSGGLLADTDPVSEIPLFLTANHCLSSDREAGTLEAYFRFRTTSCGSACYDPVGVVPRTLGATVLSTNRTGDYTLMQLGEPAPAGSTFLGWNSEPVAFSAGTELFRISHPQGAPQAYSEHKVDTVAGTCMSWPRGDWIYSNDTLGGTQGGSSGSPVLNSSGQVVGQLSGGCGTNINDDCDSVNNRTVDGAFASYYDSVKQYLDPTPCVPTSEVCNDNLDNDCDGDVDCLDSDCSNDPACSCGLPGSFCESNSDCCSNRCHPKKMTCR